MEQVQRAEKQGVAEELKSGRDNGKYWRSEKNGLLQRWYVFKNWILRIARRRMYCYVINVSMETIIQKAATKAIWDTFIRDGYCAGLLETS